MSVRHLAQVADVTGLSPTCKLVLYGISVNAGPDGHASLTNEQLRHATGLSERTVRAVLADLERKQLVRRHTTRTHLWLNLGGDNAPMRWPVQP